MLAVAEDPEVLLGHVLVLRLHLAIFVTSHEGLARPEDAFESNETL